MPTSLKKVISKSFVVLLILLRTISTNAQVDFDSLVIEYATRLDDSIQMGNIEYLVDQFDGEYFISKFIFEEENNSGLDGFNSGIRIGFKGMMQQIFSAAFVGEYSYSVVNYYEDGDQQFFLRFRLTSDGGINYHDLELVFDEENHIKIGDMYIYLTGQFLSETVGAIYYSGIAEMVSDTIGIESDPSFNYMLELQEIKKLLDTGELKLAAKRYESIDEKTREGRIFLIYGLKIYNALGDREKANAVIEEYIARYPDNPSIYLLSIDLHFARGEFDKSVAMVDSLYMITDDTYLQHFKGNMYYHNGDLINAKIQFEYVSENLPFLADNWTSLLHVYVESDNDTGVIYCLNGMLDHFNYTKQDLVDYIHSDYAEFGESEAFLNWMKE